MMEDNWVWRLITGLALISLGALLLMYTAITLLILLELFGAIALFVEFAEILFGISTPKGTAYRWAFVLRGIISMLLGVFAILLPGLTLLAAVYLLSAWAIVWGLFEVAAALAPGDEHRLHVYGRKGRMFALVAGIFSVLFGLVIAGFPELTLDILVLLFAVTAIVVGAFVAVSGLHARDKKKEKDQELPSAAGMQAPPKVL